MKHIRDTLAKTAEKTFFGNLTGTAGLWDKVLRAYEKDSKDASPPLAQYYSLYRAESSVVVASVAAPALMFQPF